MSNPSGCGAGQENMEDNIFVEPMDHSLMKSGVASLEHARNAQQKIKDVQIPEAQSAVVKAAVSAGKHKKLISDLKLRCSRVEEYYKEQEDTLTKKINDVHTREKSLESERSTVQSQLISVQSELSSMKNQLSEHQSELSSAKSRLDDAKKKMKEAEKNRNAMIAAAGILGILTFGASAAVAPIAFGAGFGAIAFNDTKKDAEEEIRRCESSIFSAQQSISQYEGKVSTLTNSLSTLTNRLSQINSEKSKYNQQRSQIQQEKGRIKKVIAFLCDAQRFGQDFSDTTEQCIDSADDMADFLRMAQQTKKEYQLFNSQGTELDLKSFEEAWDAFEEMHTKGTNYQFNMDFNCTHCGHSRHEFPHVNVNQLICSSCL